MGARLVASGALVFASIAANDVDGVGVTVVGWVVFFVLCGRGCGFGITIYGGAWA